MEWVFKFPSSRIHHKEAFHSDHKPILLCTYSEFKRFYNKGRPFWFEAMWLKDDSCERIIKESWGMGPTLSSIWDFASKLSIC